jgi:hypothetical protein
MEYIKNKDSGKELGIQHINNEIDEQKNWINHLEGMTDKRMPKEILQYESKDDEIEEDIGNMEWICEIETDLIFIGLL